MKEKETQREMVQKNIKIMAKNIPNMMKSNYLQIQAQQRPMNIN